MSLKFTLIKLSLGLTDEGLICNIIASIPENKKPVQKKVFK